MVELQKEITNRGQFSLTIRIPLRLVTCRHSNSILAFVSVQTNIQQQLQLFHLGQIMLEILQLASQ